MTDGEASGGNLYAKAIHHPDPAERNAALVEWLSTEVSDLYEDLESLDIDDDEWCRKKARMDALLLVAGIANQRRFAHHSGMLAEGGADE